jgi:hypothetical protein
VLCDIRHFIASNHAHTDPGADIVFSAASDDSTDRTDIGKIAAIRKGNMISARHHIVRGIKINPSEVMTKNLEPGV